MLYVIMGAYELQKAVKKHESPMYVLVSSKLIQIHAAVHSIFGKYIWKCLVRTVEPL